MIIYIKFPPIVDGSDYLIHLMEHCIVTQMILFDQSIFYRFRDFCVGWKDPYCIGIDFNPYDNLDLALGLIDKLDFRNEIFLTEKHALRIELDDHKEARTLLIKRLRKKIYGSNFSYHTNRGVSKKIFLSHYNQTVSRNNCLITDKNHEIIFRGANVISDISMFDEGGDYQRDRRVFDSRINNNKYRIYYRKLKSFKDIRFTFFLEFVMTGYSFYYRRLVRGYYGLIESYAYHTPDYSCFFVQKEILKNAMHSLSSSGSNDASTDDDFSLSDCIEGFIFNLEYGNYKAIAMQLLVSYGMEPDFERVKKFIRSITLDDVIKVLQTA